MAKFRNTIDLSKFRKDITKNIDGISIGFESDPSLWISTGNYTLNYLISGDFNKGIPMGRAAMLAGESSSGKSFLASGNVTKNAQDKDIFVVLIDTENALDSEWLQRLGVDVSEEKLMRVVLTLVDDVVKFISDFVKGYQEAHGSTPLNDQPPVLFVIDSLGMLMTRTEIDQAERGDIKGDMGRKAKALKQLINYTNSKFSKLNLGIICTNHTYASQDMFNPDPKISGGDSFIYASSIVVALKKGKLRDKDRKITGIRSICSVTKSRFNHMANGKKVEIEIPFDRGMDPYSGLFELFQGVGLLVKEGHSYVYKGPSGEFKAKEDKITPEQYQMMMKDHPHIYAEVQAEVAAVETE